MFWVKETAYPHLFIGCLSPVLITDNALIMRSLLELVEQPHLLQLMCLQSHKQTLHPKLHQDNSTWHVSCPKNQHKSRPGIIITAIRMCFVIQEERCMILFQEDRIVSCVRDIIALIVGDDEKGWLGISLAGVTCLKCGLAFE